MGACTFSLHVKGHSVKAAFQFAVAEACHMHGYSGYTGTIAEKTEFVLIKCPKDVKPLDHARALIDAADPRIDDKWGPAGAIQDGDGWLFFGWASE